jgi:hypothetical protein
MKLLSKEISQTYVDFVLSSDQGGSSIPLDPGSLDHPDPMISHMTKSRVCTGCA